MRRIISIFLLLCLPLYGFAMQGALPQGFGVQPLAHELEHEEGIQHHHHEEDGSIHYDESEESLVHAQEHSSSAQPFSFHVPSLTLPLERQRLVAAGFTARAVPEPFVDGPRKPPRFAPGHAAGGMTHA
ncbi:MAG: hypothetical protein AB1437_16725 [Pseudomonadota bacterium]